MLMQSVMIVEAMKMLYSSEVYARLENIVILADNGK